MQGARGNAPASWPTASSTCCTDPGWGGPGHRWSVPPSPATQCWAGGWTDLWPAGTVGEVGQEQPHPPTCLAPWGWTPSPRLPYNAEHVRLLLPNVLRWASRSQSWRCHLQAYQIILSSPRAGCSSGFCWHHKPDTVNWQSRYGPGAIFCPPLIYFLNFQAFKIIKVLLIPNLVNLWHWL